MKRLFEKKKIYAIMYTRIYKEILVEKIEIFAPAKVNLSLDIIKKKPDGYHEMRMINHSVALFDTLTFANIDRTKDTLLNTNIQKTVADRKNLVYKTAEKMRQIYGINTGVSITLKKGIPMEAGLAGGSSDAAATIIGLNQLWQLDMSLEDMYALGKSIGADVPYCCFKGTALVEGIGEKIRPLKVLPPFKILMVKPAINISTAKAFKAIDQSLENYHPNILKIIQVLEKNDFDALGEFLGNSFEWTVFEKYPELRRIKEKMSALGAFATVMSGSGSTIVGYFYKDAPAQKAAQYFKKFRNCHVFLSTVY